jgi:hypothetical protein
MHTLSAVPKQSKQSKAPGWREFQVARSRSGFGDAKTVAVVPVCVGFPERLTKAKLDATLNFLEKEKVEEITIVVSNAYYYRARMMGADAIGATTARAQKEAEWRRENAQTLDRIAKDSRYRVRRLEEFRKDEDFGKAAAKLQEHLKREKTADYLRDEPKKYAREHVTEINKTVGSGDVADLEKKVEALSREHITEETEFIEQMLRRSVAAPHLLVYNGAILQITNQVCLLSKEEGTHFYRIYLNYNELELEDRNDFSEQESMRKAATSTPQPYRSQRQASKLQAASYPGASGQRPKAFEIDFTADSAKVSVFDPERAAALLPALLPHVIKGMGDIAQRANRTSPPSSPLRDANSPSGSPRDSTKAADGKSADVAAPANASNGQLVSAPAASRSLQKAPGFSLGAGAANGTHHSSRAAAVAEASTSGTAPTPETASTPAPGPLAASSTAEATTTPASAQTPVRSLTPS